MMRVGTRTQIEASGDSVHIVIGPERDRRQRLSRLAFAVVFSFPLSAIVGAALITPPSARRNIALVGVLGTFAAAFALRIALDVSWNLFGHEELVLDGHALTMVVRLFGYRRTQSFAVAEINGLRYDAQRKNRHGFRRPRIAFEYRGRTVGTLHRITREEGHAAVRHLLAKLAGSTA
jgi:hypothetical protein